ncbi:hypothetical protein K438DRAFT_1789026 [Mycena galopus ATCC 62051]|nr:hypothetical protein K438DRAFT_1789026 [Mycena galopus ATCC 62051]
MSVNVAVVNNMVAALLSDIDEAILAQPRALSDLVPMLAGRLNDLEATPPVVSLRAPPPPGELPRASTSTSKPAGRLPRCKKCHARGHDTDSCRTTNPAAMRKRVAQNSRTARSASCACACPLCPTLSRVTGPPSRPRRFPWSSQLSLPTPRSCAAVPHNRVETNAFAGALRPPRDPLGRGGVLNVGF